ncbi:glucose uptake inhibitor SgrT [Cronobacter muytjensii]|uniref:Glucose uptake inhibitor SgrT n=1 Tax=Cronobacter muytjensii TaxID=413501 RepID=A0A2T7ARK8_9ENTR|nr:MULTISPECIES: glucose uptake inhibitor SgrT [Cronobacter]EGT4338481.1 glucose uptake inhibitor SgrT [Cronobacter muytjensii]EKS1844857.1 glucose uptake inhibitor SgrT [Cronobacter muytjensii]ELY2497048.1 glucose uptake inhibitor SgrT [Cronobacter muytjensii]ELY3984751.1 glucose uptake inhibitor SgrT [Cronobacter muytjensii]ELY4519551.1 glucose uptake inhibitor SgrT [Cronobacter muytjensii]
MKTSATGRFYQRYFSATKRLSGSWLARLSCQTPQRMLNDVMQWETTFPVTFKRR